jgi:biotin transporter BioY
VASVAAFVLTWAFRNDLRFQRWLAGVVGIWLIYLLGIIVLKFHTGMDWGAAWTNGVAPFIIPDLSKALLAAALSEGGRRLLMRQPTP